MRFAIAGLLAAALCLNAAEDQNRLSGRRAPGFSLPDSEFQRYDLQDYRGKWVAIEFVNTKCPFCKELSLSLESLKPRFGEKLQILSVVLPPDNSDTVAGFIKELKITYPVVFDQGQMAASYFNATPSNPTFHTPHLFLIDPSGTIVRDIGHGEGDRDSLSTERLGRLIDDLMAGKAPPMPVKKDSAGTRQNSQPRG